jgi:hypothetical protein
MHLKGENAGIRRQGSVRLVQRLATAGGVKAIGSLSWFPHTKRLLTPLYTLYDEMKVIGHEMEAEYFDWKLCLGGT